MYRPCGLWKTRPTLGAIWSPGDVCQRGKTFEVHMIRLPVSANYSGPLYTAALNWLVEAHERVPGIA